MAILLPEERLGQRVAGRYRLNAILSAGGMGVLFEGFDEAAGKCVAVKMLKPAYALEQGWVARFLRETRIAVRLRHPNIATVLDVWTDESGIPFLIMELLSGRSLAKELEARGILPVAEALAIAVPVAHALSAAHAIGVIHRDIKPGNIFLCRDPCGESSAKSEGMALPKLLDFGIARSGRDDFETESGMLVGTPGYMAPEQALHGECGPFTDIWGLGAVLYRCLTGRPPHAADSVPQLLRKLVCEPVAPVAVQGVSKAVCATIDRALARDPQGRYPSMKAFVDALQAATHDVGESTAVVADAFGPLARSSDPPPLVQSQRKRAPLQVSTLLIAALFAGGTMLLARRPEDVRRPIATQAPSEIRHEAPSNLVATLPPASAADETPMRPTGFEPALAEASAIAGSTRLPAAARRLPSQTRPTPAISASPSPSASVHNGTEREATTGLPIITRW